MTVEDQEPPLLGGFLAVFLGDKPVGAILTPRASCSSLFWYMYTCKALFLLETTALGGLPR